MSLSAAPYGCDCGGGEKIVATINVFDGRQLTAARALAELTRA